MVPIVGDPTYLANNTTNLDPGFQTISDLNLADSRMGPSEQCHSVVGAV